MTEGTQHRLAAIVAADVVGYSRLIAADEAGTLAAMRSHRSELWDPTTEAWGGRLVGTAGDSRLVEFPSAVAAVECSVAIQRAMVERNADIPEDRRIRLRIGINLGEVVVEGDDIHGDGVNVAARLEAEAAPEGVCLSDDVLRQVQGRLDLSFEDGGEQSFKNIARPIRVWHWTKETAAIQTTGVELAVSDKPSIAVLPFDNMSGDPEQEYFADGLTEDLITALSRWRSFPIIARNSTFAYKGTSPDIRKVGEELGARYIVEGSVRKAGGRVRITAQLINAETGHHVWAERYDRELADMFELQDEISQHIAAIVEPELSRAEGKRSAAKKPKSLDAWDYYQRGMSLLYEHTKEGNYQSHQARQMFAQAIELEPTYSQPFVGLAYSHQLDILLEYTESREDSIDKLFEAARQAIALDDTDSMAHVMMCFACRWARKHDLAITEATKAVELNPSNAFAHFHLGNVLDFAGHPNEGVLSMEKGLQLNPRDPRIHFFMSVFARAHMNARRYKDAVEWAGKAIHRRPDHPRAHAVLAISLAHLGQREEARAALDACERVRPGFAERWAFLRQYRNTADNEHILEGLRKAGWKG